MSGRFFRCVLAFCGVIQQNSFADNVPARDWSNAVAQLKVLESRGDLAGAANVAETLVRELNTQDPTNILLPEALSRLASLDQDLGRYGDAERFYRRAIELWKTLFKRPGEIATDLNNLGSLYLAIGQLQKAEAVVRESIGLRISDAGPGSPDVAFSYSNLAGVLLREKKYAEAEEFAHRAIDIWHKGPENESQADLAYDVLSLIELQCADFRSALKSAESAMNEYKKHEGKNHSGLIWYDHTLGLARQSNGDLRGADAAFHEGLNRLDQMNATRSPGRIAFLDDYAELLSEMGQKRKARELRRRANQEASELMNDHWLRYTVNANALLP